MNKHLISIIIPLYNKSNTIVETINSVLEQSYSKFEAVIIDDGSTDDSIEKVRKINDNRIKVLSKKNGGVSSARNLGLLKSRGDFILFLDADDKLYPNCLEILVNLIDDSDVPSLYCSNFDIADGEKNIKGCLSAEQLKSDQGLKFLWKKSIFLRAGNFLFPKSVVEERIFFDESLSYYEDMEYFLELLCKLPVKYTPVSTMIYCKENSNLSVNLPTMEKDWSYKVRYKFGNKFRNLIAGEIVLYSFINRIKNNQRYESVCLLLKNFPLVLFGFISLTVKKVFS